ncbi:MAG: extracellular solute-binding protein, partial [Clostridiales bacterium]|nr:extracellular solute-binding protein [Clostridiales bacterium]
MNKRLSLLLLALCIAALALPIGAVAEGSDELEPYTFSLYYNYDWWTIRPWGGDEISKLWADQFKITIDQSKPDADAAARLNLMVSSGDMPDVIQMDRGPEHMRIAQMGMFIDLAPLQAANPVFDENILASTQDLLKIDGVLYSVPHWARKGPSGGNNMWMYDKRLYEQAGSPALDTFEGLYAYAKYVKDNIHETAEGLPVIPFATGNNNDAFDIITGAFYRSMGGPNRAADYTARIDGKIQSTLRDPVFRAAVMEANRWYREGLISETQFTDTNDQMIEKFVAGRTALLYYDHSQDSINRFRQILMETYPGDSYEPVLDPVYPPSEGVTKVYADGKETIGWNVLCITHQAEQPQRIFDLFTHMLTKQGSIEMMYGPQGDWWDELDENGNPILLTPEAELPTAEKDRIGAWFWSFCSHSDNVDITKFAVNAMQEPDKRDWVITQQSDILTP